jgi:SAM-dependent methyltransferase
MMQSLKYHLSSSYRRKMLDQLLKENASAYHGRVLDIGGKDRGGFQKPKDRVEKWLFADVTNETNPDIVANVMDMHNIRNENFDVVNATELFEHVEEPRMGLEECVRVLKPGGTLIASMPFLFPIHADPSDFQRWTAAKWKRELERLGFTINIIEPMGHYFTVMMDMFKTFVRIMPLRPLKWVAYLFYPLMDAVTQLDQLGFIKKSTLGNYTTGYFIIARKS